LVFQAFERLKLYAPAMLAKTVSVAFCRIVHELCRIGITPSPRRMANLPASGLSPIGLPSFKEHPNGHR
jgi:hypothetical protein